MLIATPFVLLGVGFWALVASPWPTIWHLMLKGQRVTVARTWATVGLPALSMACFAAAIAISVTIRTERPRAADDSAPRALRSR